MDISFTISEAVSSTSRDWSAHWTVYVMNLAGVAESGTTMAVVPTCGGSCSAGAGLPDGGAVLTRNQTVTGDVSFSSPGTGRDTSTHTVDIYLFNPAAQTPGTTHTAGYGVPGSGRPLEREVLSREAKQAKRDRGVCSRWSGFQRYTSPPGTPESERDSCDEYPYLSTRQGIPELSVSGHGPAGQDNNAGGRLSEFYRVNHIGDGDGFYVQP